MEHEHLKKKACLVAFMLRAVGKLKDMYVHPDIQDVMESQLHQLPAV